MARAPKLPDLGATPTTAGAAHNSGPQPFEGEQQSGGIQLSHSCAIGNAGKSTARTLTGKGHARRNRICFSGGLPPPTQGGKQRVERGVEKWIAGRVAKQRDAANAVASFSAVCTASSACWRRFCCADRRRGKQVRIYYYSRSTRGETQQHILVDAAHVLHVRRGGARERMRGDVTGAETKAASIKEASSPGTGAA